MRFIEIIIVYLAVNNVISAMPVGIIHNASLMMMFSSNITINNSTCSQCVCTMLMSSGNSSVVSFNCYITNITSVSCQFFTMANYQISTFYQMVTNVNSTFFFLQSPSNNQTQTTTSTGRALNVIITPSQFHVRYDLVFYENCA
jgi:hypothetical protein